MSESSFDKAVKPAEARAQSAEFLGIFTGIAFDLGEGDNWWLPNPAYLPPVMRKRYNEHLRFMGEELDTKTETYEHPVTGKATERTTTMFPLRHKKKLIDEDELLCIALMGEGDKDRDVYLKDGTLPAVYEKFIAAGGVPGEVQVHWRVMQVQLQERLNRDPKSS